MTAPLPEGLVIGEPEATNDAMRRLVGKVRIDHSSLAERDGDVFRRRVLSEIGGADIVLDCGQSLRGEAEAVRAKAARYETLDIVGGEPPPSIQADLCQPIEVPELQGRYDKIACLAVLEHCYDPFGAEANLRRMTKPGGTLYGYVPYLFRYHAKPDLAFQDYWRFSKDALAYLFREWSGLTLYPLRGRVSTSLNLMLPFWKWKVEPRAPVNQLVDRAFSAEENGVQCSGYNFVAVL